jgi:hypothetical protein
VPRWPGAFYRDRVTGRQDSDFPWGSDIVGDGRDADGDVIEQGEPEAGPGWLDRFRWRPPRRPLTAGLVAAALVVGLLGGYLAGNSHGRQQAQAAARKSAASTKAGPLPDSIGLAETGSQCSTVLGHTLQVGVEVVNGTSTGMQLGQVIARFPEGGLKLTAASWGPCGTLPYAHPAVSSVLANGSSTWLTVTVTTESECPQGLPVEYVASYDQHGQTFTVVLPGFVELGGQPMAGCPSS